MKLSRLSLYGHPLSTATVLLRQVRWNNEKGPLTQAETQSPTFLCPSRTEVSASSNRPNQQLTTRTVAQSRTEAFAAIAHDFS